MLPWLIEREAPLQEAASSNVRDVTRTFRASVEGLPAGGTASLPDGTSVTRPSSPTYPTTFLVDGEPATRGYDAAEAALNKSAGKTHPLSIGGDVSFPTADHAMTHAYTGNYQTSGGIRVPPGRLLPHGVRRAAADHIAAHERMLTEEALAALTPADLQEAADSLAKASTPEPFSSSKTSNWVARGGGLPAYIQHIAHDLVEKRGKTESEAISMAIGIVKRWAAGGGNVDAGTKAAASKAVSEWEALKAKNAGKKAAKAGASAVKEADVGLPWLRERAEPRPTQAGQTRS